MLTAGTILNATAALLLMTSSKDTGLLFSQSTSISQRPTLPGTVLGAEDIVINKIILGKSLLSNG